MLTMRQIWKATPWDRKARAQNVRVVKLKYGMHKVAKVPVAAATTYSLEVDGGKPTWFQYVTAIQFLPKRYVKVTCSCPDFCFRWEYALHKQGAADIKFCNGEPPGVRNPGLIPGQCKHLVALYTELVNREIID